MKREEVVAFINKETKRLREEEHFDDLVKANRFDELKQLEYRISKPVHDFLYQEWLILKDEEIEEGACFVTATWFASCTEQKNDYLFDSPEQFAYRMARESGRPGKNVASLMLDGCDLFIIDNEDYFSDRYVEEFEEKYTFEGATD